MGNLFLVNLFSLISQKKNVKKENCQTHKALPELFVNKRRVSEPACNYWLILWNAKPPKLRLIAFSLVKFIDKQQSKYKTKQKVFLKKRLL